MGYFSYSSRNKRFSFFNMGIKSEKVVMNFSSTNKMLLGQMP